MIRNVKETEIDELVQLGKDIGIFNVGEAEELLGDTLVKLFAGQLPNGHQAHALEIDNQILGWVYFGPTEVQDIWNLWWIGVKVQQCGYGKQLLRFFENTAIQNQAKRVIIETSSSVSLEGTRNFYVAQGYQVYEIEKDGYGIGEDKIVYFKAI